MRGNQVEQGVTIMTEGERIEGTLFHMDGIRLSDFLNSPLHSEVPYVKIKNPRVYCRRTGQELAKAPFLIVARDRIVLVIAHATPESEDASGLEGGSSGNWETPEYSRS